MRAQLFGILVAVLALPHVAWAQRVPHSGSSAIGGDVGIYLPRESTMTTGPALDAFFEHYIDARNSLRVDFGWANPKYESEHADSVRQMRLGGDVLHNWEGGSVHPYVGAGLGVYFLQQRDNGQDFGTEEKRFGGQLLGGIEYFTSNTFAVKGEAAYHVVSKIGEFNPSGLSLLVGAKVYF